METKKLKAKDLKLGNYVSDFLGEIAVVTQLGHVNNPDYIGFDYLNGGGGGQNECYGIPITPEILKKSDFLQETPDNRYGEVYRKEKFRFIVRKVNFGIFPKEDYGWAFELSDMNDWVTIKSKIQYLHELQNLVIDLSGEELPIEL